jgi:DUF971 family protein
MLLGVPSTTPVAVRLKLPENLLEVDWDDGATSRYDGAFLRFVCPCAACRGHGPGQVPEPRWADVKGVRMTGAEAVGGYALRLGLTDGHASGIYSWEFLRAHDPGPGAGRGIGDPA